MKKTISYAICGLAAIASLNGLTGCSAENPFATESGEGTLRLQMVVNSTVTRTYEYDEEKDLAANCVVYISDLSKQDNVLHKYRGLENVPNEIRLQTGHYVAEAWTGDSVSASWDKKFYRGYTPFDIKKNSVEQVVVNCKVQNVVVAINQETIDPNLMKDDYTITVKNSRAELEFNSENVETGKAYFMMPDGETSLEYTISGTRRDGKHFEKSGTIDNVERTHLYTINFKYNPDISEEEELGGAFITIRIEDEPIPETDSVKLYSAPSIAGLEFDIEKQQICLDGNVPDMIVKVCAFGSLTSLNVITDDYAELGLPGASINLIKATDAYKTQAHNAGLTWESTYKESTNLETCHITLSGQMLTKLPASETERVITIKAEDKYGKTNEARIRIANTEGAIILEDPIVVEQLDSEDWQNVKAHSVNISYSLADEVNGNPGVEYRMKDSGDDWTFAAVSSASGAPSRAAWKANKKSTVTISGLQPGKTYEYRACAKYSDGEDYHGAIMSVTTESTFTIPNASFEDWSTYSASTLLGTKTVTLPWSVGDKGKSFWGSGNEGSATANMTLTDKTTDMIHSGTYAARLESKSAMGVIAAGNIFIGEYVKTDGTNGVLSVGREFNGSHPSALRVFANYRPAGGVKVKSGNESFVPNGFAGGSDHGQIYVALTTEAVEIRTNPNDRKLFSEDDAVVLAYGQVSWTGNFGPDGSLQKVEIPLTYKAKAKTTKPTHLVIVCSASKYGDYFSGAAGSVMYLDDFELIYE